MEVAVGFVPTSRRIQTSGLIRGPKALKNHLWLLSFFLFCSFKQKIICTGQDPIEVSPLAVQITLVVYLHRFEEIMILRTTKLTQKCER